MEKGGVPHLPGDPGEEAEAKARGKEEEAEEGRPHGALGEGVDRLDDPASGEEGAEKGGGEGQGHEGKVPGLEGPPGLLDEGRVEEGRGEEPGDEAGVLHRVPGPVPAPAQDLVAPPHPRHLPRGEEAPGDEGPPPGLLHPGLVAPGGHGRHRVGVGHAQAHETQVHEDGVDGHHPVVLEEGVRAHAVGRRVGQGLKGARDGGHDPEEEDLDAEEHGEDQGGPPGVQGLAAGEQGVEGLEEAPEEDAALEGRPRGHQGHPEGVLGGVVPRHVGQAEVVDEKGPLQGEEGGKRSEEGRKHEGPRPP